ncbi:MAG: PhnD/SsuA/transferrin family substrate-binding protein [Proteobacteria bacterium]|nr:PhnD/SsuA/transferrin family substrate-binding protein [Pseudomonadota bacterium]
MQPIQIIKTLSFIVVLLYGVGAQAELTLLVNAPRSPVKAQKKWSGVAQHLSRAVGEKINIVAVPPGKTELHARMGKTDIMIINPVMSTLVAHRYNGKMLATVKRNSGAKFGGVILSKKGSGIIKAADLRGKNIMTYKKASAAAYAFQMYHLKTRGVVESDFASMRVAKRQDDIVLAVRAGVVDAGFVKTGLLEAMAKEGKIRLEEFEIIDAQAVGYANVHSTTLYPEWYLLATSSKGKKHAAGLAQAALSMSVDNSAAKKAKIKGFVKPLSRKNLDKMLRSMHLPPFDA